MKKTTTMRSLTVPFLVCMIALPATAQANELRAQMRAVQNREPTCEQVQEKALAYFRVHPERLEWLRSAASWKALVPTLELSTSGTAAELGEETKLDEYSSEVNWVTRGASGMAGEVRAKFAWDLPRLVYNAEELDVTGLSVVQRDVVERVTRVYYLRRRLQLQIEAQPVVDATVQLEQELKLDELTSLLSGMTGGWFREEVRRRGG